MSSLDLISQTLTSPEYPPVAKNLKLLLMQRVVTPLLCALSMVQSSSQLSVLKDLILPSDHPEITTSSVKLQHVGCPPAKTAHLA